MKIFLVISLFFSFFNCNASEEEFNSTFIGHCYNYALATSHAEEYSYVLTFDQEINTQLKTSLEQYFLIEYFGVKFKYIITYRDEISLDETLAGAILVDQLLSEAHAVGSCYFVSK